MSLKSPRRLHAVAAVAVFVSLLGWSGQAAAEDVPPTITLLGPANGSTVTLKPDQDVTFRWQLAWAAPPTSADSVKFELALDPGFTQIGTTENQSCTPTGTTCVGSFTPNRVYEPYGRTWYWRITSRSGATAKGSFKVKLLPDTVRPRVRAISGTVVRGTIALFAARMADDRKEVRFRATLSYRGRVVVAGSYPFGAMGWDRPYVFETEKPLSKSLPAGRYSFCVQVWDRAGNTARHCTPFKVL